MLVSSAKSKGCVKLEASGRSLMYSIKNRGPKMEPWGYSALYSLLCGAGFIKLYKLLTAGKIAFDPPQSHITNTIMFELSEKNFMVKSVKCFGKV